MKNITNFITEKLHQFKTLEDIEKYLTKFKDDETSWKGATDEVMDMARWTREYLEELDNIKVDAIQFKNLKTPSEWNTVSKNYILNNFKKMSNSTQKEFLKYISNIL